LYKSFLHASYKPTQYSISFNIKEQDRRRTAKNLFSGIIMIVDLAKNIPKRMIDIRENFLIYRFPNKPASNEKESILLADCIHLEP
jgi:hypothetical protein